jgi:ABC-type multidrug transport system fused ATPase/permease subunit
MNAVLSFFLRPYRKPFSLLAIFLVGASLLEGITVAAFFPVVLAITQTAETDQLPAVLEAIVSVAERMPGDDLVVSASLLLGLVLLVRTVALLARDAAIASTGGRILYDLQKRLMEGHLNRPYHFFVGQKHGALLYQTVVAPGNVALALQKIPRAAAEGLKILTIMGILFLAFPIGASAVLALGAGYLLVTRRLSTTLAYDTGAGRSAAYAEQLEVTQQFLSGVRDLRVYGAERHWLDVFDRASQQYRKMFVKYFTWLSAPRHVMELVAVAVLLGAIVLGRMTQADGFSLWLPAIGMFAVAILQLMPALAACGRMLMEVQEATPNLERLHKLMTQPSGQPERGKRVFEGLKQQIALDNLTFSYEAHSEVLRGVSAQFPRGSITGVTGPSGTGKTTIINLLLGLLEPTAGAVLVDSAPLREFEIGSWLRHVGFVGQDPFVFHGTLAENIRFGRERFSHAEIEGAARLAHADEFIQALPDGYDTVVGERGAKLSGGQQQRLAIARALLGDPDLLILDEPTSALDQESKHLVQEALLDAAKNRTVIIVTHDETAFTAVDQVLRLVPNDSADESGKPGSAVASIEPLLKPAPSGSLQR